MEFTLNDIKEWVNMNTDYKVFLKDIDVTKKKSWNHENKTVYSVNLTHTPVPTTLTIEVYDESTYAFAEGRDFTTRGYKISSLDDLDQVIASMEDCFNSLTESTESDADIYMDIEDELDALGENPKDIAGKMSFFAEDINNWIELGLSAESIAKKLLDLNF